MLANQYWCVHVLETTGKCCWLVHFYFFSMSGSFYLVSLWDGKQVAVQVLFCGVRLPGFIWNSTKKSWVITNLQLVQPYSSTITVTSWKNSCFILPERSDCDMIDNLLMAVHTFPMCMLTLLFVDEMMLPKYVNWSTNFRGIPFTGTILIKTHELYFTWVPTDINATCCLLQAMQQGFGLNKYICEKHKIICIICIHYDVYQW